MNNVKCFIARNAQFIFFFLWNDYELLFIMMERVVGSIITHDQERSWLLYEGARIIEEIDLLNIPLAH